MPPNEIIIIITLTMYIYTHWHATNGKSFLVTRDRKSSPNLDRSPKLISLFLTVQPAAAWPESTGGEIEEKDYVSLPLSIPTPPTSLPLLLYSSLPQFPTSLFSHSPSLLQPHSTPPPTHTPLSPNSSTSSPLLSPLHCHLETWIINFMSATSNSTEKKVQKYLYHALQCQKLTCTQSSVRRSGRPISA